MLLPTVLLKVLPLLPCSACSLARCTATSAWLPSRPRRYREAMRSFQAAVRVQATDPLAHFRIGNTLFALKKYAEARKVRHQCVAGWGVGERARVMDADGACSGACRCLLWLCALLHIWVRSAWLVTACFLALLRCSYQRARMPIASADYPVPQQAGGVAGRLPGLARPHGPCLGGSPHIHQNLQHLPYLQHVLL